MGRIGNNIGGGGDRGRENLCWHYTTNSSISNVPTFSQLLPPTPAFPTYKHFPDSQYPHQELTDPLFETWWSAKTMQGWYYHSTSPRMQTSHLSIHVPKAVRLESTMKIDCSALLLLVISETVNSTHEKVSERPVHNTPKHIKDCM